MKNAEEFLKDKLSSINGKQLLVGLFATGVVVSGYFVIPNLIKKIKAKREEMAKKKLLEFNKSYIVTDNLKCLVCTENPKNIILKPCMHLCLCKECWNKLE